MIAAASCSDRGNDASGNSSDNNTSSTLQTPEPVRAATPKAPKAPLARGTFALGVASGDPRADRVILWTRLVSNPEVSGGGAPGHAAVDVAYDVATDRNFDRLVASGVAVAEAKYGHSIHVDVTGLDAGTEYFYRFRVTGETSPVGRTKTLPAAGAAVDQFRFVFATCQDYQWGYFGAWAHAAAEPGLDAVVFLGDYIYELSLGDLSPDKSGKRVWASPVPESLDDYRWRYAQTKSDPDLQSAHAAAPWWVTFDDHEVGNNYAGDVDPLRPAGAHERRLAAYQAWFEHQPVRIDPLPTSFDELIVNRSADIGATARLMMIETREHADVAPCRTPGASIETLTDEGPSCDELVDEKRSPLGATQEEWLIDQLATSKATWNILANPVMFGGCNVGTADKPEYGRDTWDGYPAARQRIVDAIVSNKVSNPVVVTGDWHAGFGIDVTSPVGGSGSLAPNAPKLADGAKPPVIMPEFLVTSITTINFPTDYTAINPQQRYFVGPGHGYAVATITADQMTCAFKYVADEWDPATAIARTDTFVVDAGDPIFRKQ